MSYNEKTKKRYNNRLKKFGYDPKTLGWLKGRQGIRFSALTEIGDLNNSSIVDIGCGFGDLYGFLQHKKYQCRYIGLDLNPELIRYGKMKYPKAKFEVFDIEKDPISGIYDWAIISGLFNFKRENNLKFIEMMLHKIFNSCRKGVAVDFMTSYVDYKVKNASYTSPEQIFKICKKITKRVSIRHDYMPFEFCVYIYKNQNMTKDHIFTEFRNLVEPDLRTNKWLKKPNTDNTSHNI